MLYQVLFLSHHEETMEVLVHYVGLTVEEMKDFMKDGTAIWTRTLKNFSETVEHKGETMPRFKRIDSTIDL